MIVTEYQLVLLRRGKTITVKVPAGQPAPGARKPKPPVTLGRSYSAQLAPFTEGKLRVLATALELVDGEWHVTVVRGDLEQPVFLAAQSDAIYTTEVRRALRDEPEVIPFSYEERCRMVAKSVGRVRDPRGRNIRTSARGEAK